MRRLIVENLTIRAGDRALVENASFTVEAGKIVAIVGPSGAGKTVTARSLMGLRGPVPGVVSGAVIVEEPDVTASLYDSKAEDSRSTFARLRGDVLGYLPQHARQSLDPLWTVRRQVKEAMDLAQRTDGVEHWLGRAGFERPDEVANLFPHELSGGMAQRVCIALALARGSRFLVADEPTTGLDPTVQRAILDEIRQTARDGVGVLLITHDLRIVSSYADRVVIMSGGRTVEQLPAARLGQAESAQGQALLAATARLDRPSAAGVARA